MFTFEGRVSPGVSRYARHPLDVGRLARSQRFAAATIISVVQSGVLQEKSGPSIATEFSAAAGHWRSGV